QAEDGIRDRTVTGVQTCALPICAHQRRFRGAGAGAGARQAGRLAEGELPAAQRADGRARRRPAVVRLVRVQRRVRADRRQRDRRSEERRVGKEGSQWWSVEEYTT